MKRVATFFSLVAMAAGLVCVNPGAQATGVSDAAQYLAIVMDQFHGTVDVYTDSHAAGNHFVMRGLMNSSGDQDAVSAMTEDWRDQPHSGIDCIKAQFKIKTGRQNWGGWYFMNGVLQGEETAPKANWGDYPNAGLDLRNATTLTFWARGSRGGEQVEFFCFGVGRNADTGQPEFPYPDSSAKISKYVTLSNNWQQYDISLSGDLSYVLGGFGWVAKAQDNSQDIVFYLDDIKFNKSRLDDNRFLVSYKTIASNLDFDVVLRNTAFTYDNAVALLAFLATGEKARAQKIAEALCYAWRNDRYFRQGWLRNAYQGGDLKLFPGWTPHGWADTVRMPGWWDTQALKWFEDEFQVSTHTGNVAWAMLALLRYYKMCGGDSYLNTVAEMGNWVEQNCRSNSDYGGYTGGYQGWEPNQVKLKYKATEHNIDLYAAFQGLFLLTHQSQWRERAQHAANFVHQMWNGAAGHFWTGTKDDGSINQDVIPLDIQAWANLAFYNEARGRGYDRALAFCEQHHWTGKGYDFDTDKDGVWYEGTGQMAVAYHRLGNNSKHLSIVQLMRDAQFSDGSLPAADIDGLTTGFLLINNKDPWLYYRRSHIAATGWFIFAEKGFNPFRWQSSCLEGIQLLMF